MMAPPRKGDLSPEEKDLLGVIAAGEPGLALAPRRLSAVVLLRRAWPWHLHLVAGTALGGGCAALCPLLPPAGPCCVGPTGRWRRAGCGPTAGALSAVTRRAVASAPAADTVPSRESGCSSGNECALLSLRPCAPGLCHPRGLLARRGGVRVAAQFGLRRPNSEGLILPKKAYILPMRICVSNGH